MDSIRSLIVEDSSADAELLIDLLQRAPRARFTIHRAFDVASALKLLEHEAVDVVLLDLSLPDARDLEALRALRAAVPHLPIVVLTGLDDEDAAIRAVKEGAQDYLVKDRIDDDGLVRAVRYAIERARAEDAARRLIDERARREAADRARIEAEQLYRSLDETNRGIMALYAELDEKTDSLRRTSEVKSRVVSNVSHEFRTPLNSILGLVRLLLTRNDGPVTAEQEKQLGYILRSATELSALVNDLLDLSQMEAGRVRLHTGRFEVAELFAALRGMCRPLKLRDTVELVFEDPGDVPVLETDEGKISQIMRNLLSNAIKFTREGEIRVRAKSEGGLVELSVTDTGVGIAPADLERIFEEFTQLENSLQNETKGTGLGLSLSRRLAELLGGVLTVESTAGLGSTFKLTVPLVHPEVKEMAALQVRGAVVDPHRAPVLVVEDDRQTLFLYEKYLMGSGFQVIAARSIEDARAVLGRTKPAAIVLDIMLEGETSWRFLSELKTAPETRDVPILVVTVTDRENKARALGADEFWMKPMDQEWLLRKLNQIAKLGPVEKILVIDDDEVSRYLVRRLLHGTSYRVIEATGGKEGVRLARAELPNVILLDFVMPGMSAFEVIDELKVHPDTRPIPIIIHTSKSLGDSERSRLSADAAAILNKQSLSREVAISRIREALVNAGVSRTSAQQRAM
jgi:signal transduction histidine kinase